MSRLWLSCLARHCKKIGSPFPEGATDNICSWTLDLAWASIVGDSILIETCFATFYYFRGCSVMEVPDRWSMTCMVEARWRTFTCEHAQNMRRPWKLNICMTLFCIQKWRWEMFFLRNCTVTETVSNVWLMFRRRCDHENLDHRSRSLRAKVLHGAPRLLFILLLGGEESAHVSVSCWWKSLRLESFHGLVLEIPHFSRTDVQGGTTDDGYFETKNGIQGLLHLINYFLTWKHNLREDVETGDVKTKDQRRTRGNKNSTVCLGNMETLI